MCIDHGPDSSCLHLYTGKDDTNWFVKITDNINCNGPVSPLKYSQNIDIVKNYTMSGYTNLAFKEYLYALLGI